MKSGQPADEGADPQGAVGAFGNGRNTVVRQAAVGRGVDLPSALENLPPGALMEAGQPAVLGADPQGAVGARGEDPNEVVRQVAVGPGEDLPGAFMEAGQPAAKGADPEGAIGARGEGPNAVVRHRR